MLTLRQVATYSNRQGCYDTAIEIAALRWRQPAVGTGRRFANGMQSPPTRTNQKTS